MDASYTSLSTSPDEDYEREEIANVVHTNQAIRKPSSWSNAFLHVLCILTVAFAFANLFQCGMHYTRIIDHDAAAGVDTLPYPDVFVGLPQTRSFHVDDYGADGARNRT